MRERMNEAEEHKILADSRQLIKNCNECLAEVKEIDRGVAFLINEYKTNKRYFRVEPGKVTIEDVIKTAFEFGWSSKRNYDSQTK